MVKRRVHLEAIEEYENEEVEREKMIMKRAIEQKGNEYTKKAVDKLDDKEQGKMATIMVNEILKDDPEAKRQIEEKLKSQFERIKEENDKKIEDRKKMIDKMKKDQEIQKERLFRRKKEYKKEIAEEQMKMYNEDGDILFGEEPEPIQSEEEDLKKLGKEELEELINRKKDDKERLEKLKNEVEKERFLSEQKEKRLDRVRKELKESDPKTREIADYIVFLILRRVEDINLVKIEKRAYLHQMEDYLIDKKLKLNHIENNKFKDVVSKLILEQFLESQLNSFIKESITENYLMALKVS